MINHQRTSVELFHVDRVIYRT